MTNSNNYSNSVDEYTTKEQLYTLFYELSSEIKGQKIEIDAEEFEENIRTISITQLLNYIREAIQILLKKLKPASKEKQKTTADDISQFELLLRKYEQQKRNSIKNEFQFRIHKEALEYKLEEYMEMEEEFEEMKTKLKYEDGKFLDNDRKDNEIIILRAENTNLKNLLMKNETSSNNFNEKLTEKEEEIKELKKKVTDLTQKLEKTEKELNLFSNINININNNNNSSLQNHYGNKCSFCLYNNNISEINPNGSQIKLLDLKSIKSQPHKNQHEIHSAEKQKGLSSSKVKHNRNNSMNMLLDKKKLDLISKYFSNRFSSRHCSSLKINKKKNIKKGPLSISQAGLSNRNSLSSFVKSSNGSYSKHNSSSNGSTKNIKKRGFILHNLCNKNSIFSGIKF